MLERLLSDLSKYLNEKIYDIIIFGSVTRGKDKPGDIDILILFKEFDENIYLELSKRYHVLAVKLEDIFSLSSILVEILAEGWSVKHKKPLREILGIKAYKEFLFKRVIYGEKKDSKKTSLHYFLYGRKDRNKEGLLKETRAEVVRRNPFIIRVPIEYSEMFKKKMNIFAKTKGIEIELEERTVIIGKVSLVKIIIN